MSDVQHFIIATAGHVDHGKSALVRALTGTDPDRLPQEKLRGITIDLGFGHLEFQFSDVPSSTCQLGIVDVPGHEDFIKNMVAGVGSIDLALLVIAADDGWMPQTEEHLQILMYLGVTRALVALTKIDLVQDEKSIRAEIRAKLANTPFQDAPIVPTSTLDGRGIYELKSALAAMVAATPPARDIGKPRLPVDRVFSLQGAGTIVTGTLMGGTLRRGQTLIVQPRGKQARIRTIQSHNHGVELIGPGTRTALNIPDLTVGQDIQRGDVLTLPVFGDSVETVDVLLGISPRAIRPIKHNTRVWIHHGSNRVATRIAFFLVKMLGIGEQALAQLRFENPAFLFDGDRFVVRDWAEQVTLAGGVVLDADAVTALFKGEARMNFLKQRADASDDSQPQVLSRIRSHVLSLVTRDGAVEQSKVLLKSHFSGEEVRDVLSRLVSDEILIVVRDNIVDMARWSAARDHAIDVIDRTHRRHPEYIGVSLVDLRAALDAELLFDGMFDALVKDLCSSDFVQVGALIRRTTHRPELPAQLQEAGARVRAALVLRPFDPPSRKELSPDSSSRQALLFLIKTGEAVEITGDIVMAAESETRATEIIQQFICENGPATVSELRQKLGSSRRVIIPFLERLDRLAITERVDDTRNLCKQR